MNEKKQAGRRSATTPMDPRVEEDKFVEVPPEVELTAPVAPWRDGSYEQFEGRAYADLVEEPALVKKIRAAFPAEVLAFRGYRGDATLLVRPEKIIDVIRFIRDDEGSLCDLLRDLFALDNLKTAGRLQEWADLGIKDARFEVVYLLYSLRFKHSLRVRTPLPDKEPAIDSLVSLYRCVDWFEREAWDMYGINFRGHPNLRRILNHEAFVGHPLRKDYPVNRRHNFLVPTDM